MALGSMGIDGFSASNGPNRQRPPFPPLRKVTKDISALQKYYKLSLKVIQKITDSSSLYKKLQRIGGAVCLCATDPDIFRERP